MGGVTDAERAPEQAERNARIELAQLTEPGDGSLGAALEQASATELMQRIRAHERSLLPLVDNYRVRLPTLDDGMVERLAESSVRYVIPGDSEWPTQLDDLGPARPVGLFIRGADLRLAALRSVAVVGARAATQYGIHVATEWGSDLADRGWTVVSGGAYGIDAAAHRGALAVGGTTVAVLACGVDVSYPRGNTTLFERISSDGGCVVSELPPGSHPTRPRFLQRNRVIAAISRATLVVEAASRSGALNTAALARQLGRQVMAVPGPITSAMSEGCHTLVQADEPARLVTGIDDVVEEAGSIGELAPPPARDDRVRDGLDPVSLSVLEAVPVKDPAIVETIAERAGVPVAAVAGILLRLTAARLIADRGDRGYQLIRGAGDLPLF